MRNIFDNPRSQQITHYNGFSGVKTNENGLFLYKSNQADYLLRDRFMDYFLMFSFGGWAVGASPFLIMPFIFVLVSTPRKYAIMNYFTFHAELLPHTEQVVFHKATF